MLTLREYFYKMQQSTELFEVRLRFESCVMPIIKTIKYYYGFIDEEEVDGRTDMNFITSDLQYFSRWLIMYADAVEIISPQKLKDILGEYVRAIKKRF
jgi:predicted DNA-binding transcriptional regulator YafY